VARKNGWQSWLVCWMLRFFKILFASFFSSEKNEEDIKRMTIKDLIILDGIKYKLNSKKENNKNFRCGFGEYK